MSPWQPRLLRTPAVVWGVDATHLAWHGRGGTCDSAPLADALPRATALLPPRARVDVIAGGDLAVHWLQTPPAGVASLHELQLVAAARCAHLYGGSPQDWWVAGDWSVGRPFVCAALPHALAAPVQQALDDAGARVRWHTAWWVAGTDRAAAFPRDGWSALRTPERVYVWHCREGQITAMASDRVPAGAPDPAAAERAEQLARLEAVRDPALSSGTVHWATAADQRGGEARAAQGLAQRLQQARGTPARLHFVPADGSRPRLSGHAPRAAASGPAVLMLAFALLGSAAWEAWQTEAELGAARSALAMAQRPKVAQPGSPLGAKATLTPAQRTAWARIARQLNTPWGDLLDALESSLPESVALVAIEPDAAQGSVRLQAEARALDALLAYADGLRSVPLFAQVHLVKHETNEQDVNRPLRLGLDVRLRVREDAAIAPHEALR